MGPYIGPNIRPYIVSYFPLCGLPYFPFVGCPLMGPIEGPILGQVLLKLLRQQKIRARSLAGLSGRSWSPDAHCGACKQRIAEEAADYQKSIELAKAHAAE